MMKEITRTFIKDSVNSYVEIATKFHKNYEGVLVEFIEDNLVLDSDLYVNYSDIKTIKTVIIH